MKKNVRTIKVPWHKNEKKIFGAFIWNTYILKMYEGIFEKVVNDPIWERKYNFTWRVQYGSRHILKVDKGWKREINDHDIEEFVNRNKQLYEIFVKGISSCDLFIADITDQNPNVMLELGIAIQQDKNILLVTSQDIKDLPFDIRGLEAKKYRTKDDLFDLLKRELEIYCKIKEQQFKPGKFISAKKYTSSQKGVVTDQNGILVDAPKLKNVRIRMNFKFMFSTNHNDDWFGVTLRTQGVWRRNPSELVLIRYSGVTRSLTWPEQRPQENEGKTIDKFDPCTSHTLEILIDENRLKAWVDNQLVITDEKIIVENFGSIYIGCLDHRNRLDDPAHNEKGNYLEVEYKNIEILDLSTTANLFNE